MTHDELLAKIKWHIDYGKYPNCDCLLCGTSLALRAVLQLHKPFDDQHWVKCNNCLVIYPCRTIQAIEKDLK